MPIRKPETAIFPPNLLEEPINGGIDRLWWVLHTKARHEKAVARHLSSNSVPFYLPLIRRQHLLRNRKVTSYSPLFSGYVFVYGSYAERDLCVRTNRLANVLPVPDGDKLRNDLNQVRGLIETDAPLTLERRIEPGHRVRVTAGPLAGTEGVVVRRQRKSRLIVSVHLIQQGVSIEVDDWLLEVIN